MNPITLIIICILFLLGLTYLLMRIIFLKGLNHALKQEDYQAVRILLKKSQAKWLLSDYLRDLYQARVYYLSKDEESLISHLRYMMNKSYEKTDEEQYLALYYHTFLTQGNYDPALELLEQIYQCENDKLIRYCDWTRDVLLNHRNDLCDEIIAALDNKDYYGFPLGTCAYLIAVQKKRLGAYEEAILWFDAAKDVLQPQDLYFDDIVKEITALQKMGYQLPQKKTRKKSI